MVPTYPPLEAYRRDVARVAPAKSFGPDDQQWLAASRVLERYVDARPLERRFLAADLATYLAAGDETTICDAALRFAFGIEKTGAMHLAASWLGLLNRLIPRERHREHGRILAVRARLVRKFGDMDTAHAMYEEVERLGQRFAEPELTSRAWTGFGVIAQSRGNWPESRRWFSAAALVADDNACVQAAYNAHLGLQSCALVGRDFDLAMHEGWTAFLLAAGDPELEAECLTNLAQILYECGEYRSALRGFAGAVAKATYLDTLLPALAGVAIAGARLGKPAIVDAAGARMERLYGAGWPLPHALALLEMSDANLILGRIDEAKEFRTRARTVAGVYGFHEVTYRVDNPPASENTEPATKHAFGANAYQIAHGIERIGAPLDLYLASSQDG